MKNTPYFRNYLREMRAVLTESKYIVGQLNTHKLEVYICKKDFYKKRNGKLCFIEYPGSWVKIPSDYIKYTKRSQVVLAHHYFQTDDMYTTKEWYEPSISKELKEKIIEDYLETVQ